MGYLIRDSNTKANFSFSVPKRIIYSADGETDEPVETVIEEEEEPIPEEAQGQSTDQAQNEGPEVEEEAPEEIVEEEEEEEDDSNWIEGGECVPDLDHQCGQGMYCSFETGTCVSDENQEEEQLAYDEEQEQKREEEAAEAKAIADQEAADAKAIADQEVADYYAKAKADKEAADAKAKAEKEAVTKKKTSKTSAKSGGGGGSGGGGKYMTKNDKLWKKKLSKKGVVSKVSPVEGNSPLKLIGLGVLSIGGFFAYKKYGGLKKKAGKLDKIQSIVSSK